VPRLDWNAVGSRTYEVGVDRGVLYVDSQPGVPWNGLTSVNESSSGGEAQAYYIDGVKYLNLSTPEEFQATVTAFTYPDEFGQCDGTAQVRTGLFVTQQRRKSFGLSYRTKIGNDLTPDHGYKIHLIYNALAAPSDRDNATISDSTDPNDFSWAITTRPPAMTGYHRTSHVVIDSRYTDPVTLAAVEDILYGTDVLSASLPSLSELSAIFDTVTTLIVTDNGDGTFTIEGPDSAVEMLDERTFQINWPTAVYLDEISYTVSS
jgi:hypothetical protein